MGKGGAKKPKGATDKGGRPRHVITDEEIAEGRKLLGKHAYRSDVAQRLMEKFTVGKEVAYRIIDRAAAETRAELAKSGAVTPDMLAYSGLLQIATAEDASHKDRTRAWGQIIRMLQLKIPDGLNEEEAVRQYLREVGARQQARESQPTPTTEQPQ